MRAWKHRPGLDPAARDRQRRRLVVERPRGAPGAGQGAAADGGGGKLGGWKRSAAVAAAAAAEHVLHAHEGYQWCIATKTEEPGDCWAGLCRRSGSGCAGVLSNQAPITTMGSQGLCYPSVCQTKLW